jgi:hypothetical protein
MLGTCDIYEFVKRQPATIADVAQHFRVSAREAENAIDAASLEGVGFIGINQFGGRLYGITQTN